MIPTRFVKFLAPAALSILAGSFGLAGCVYKVNISQGNYLEAKTISQAKEGMTRAQIRFLLGTPMVGDNFHPERWDYMYYYKVGKTQKVDRQWVVIYFENDKVSRIEHKTGEFKDPKTLALPGI
jgi:outer membrane protein assembly factor BamE